MAILMGIALAIVAGFANFYLNAPTNYGLEERLYVIDKNGLEHSPTSKYTRSILAELSKNGVDISEKKWPTDVYFNEAHDPDIITKLMGSKH